jgi:hypothetical protein
MTDEINLSMSLPLDADGFLRRECPTCGREFKWFADQAQDSLSEPVPDAGYHCPLCDVQAPEDSWWTQAQAELARDIAAKAVLGPEMEKLADTITRSGGGMIEMRMDVPDLPEPRTLSESDDMRRVDFECHPSEPVKVPDDWTAVVHCLICGAPAVGG